MVVLLWRICCEVYGVEIIYWYGKVCVDFIFGFFGLMNSGNLFLFIIVLFLVIGVLLSYIFGFGFCVFFVVGGCGEFFKGNLVDKI